MFTTSGEYDQVNLDLFLLDTNAIVVVQPPVNAVPNVISKYSADFSGAEDLIAAVAGKSHYIKKLKIQCASAITVDIGSAQTTGVTLIYIGPIPFSASGPAFEIDFGDKAMKIAEGTSFAIDASGAGAVAVYAEYVTGD